MISIRVPATERMNCAMAADQGIIHLRKMFCSNMQSIYQKEIFIRLVSSSLLCSYPDEFESTRIIGERQFRKAVELFDKATEKLTGKIRSRHAYIDFTKLKVSVPQEGGGEKVVQTCPAALGFAFAAGTTDGPGAFDFKQGDNQVNKTKHFSASSSNHLYFICN